MQISLPVFNLKIVAFFSLINAKFFRILAIVLRAKP